MKNAMLLSFLLSLFAACPPGPVQRAPDGSSDRSVLANVRTTGRISSNRYADLVLDRTGNSYIACFFKAADGRDRISFSKLSPEGVVLWEKGVENRGRATAVAIDREERLWVAGFFEDELAFDDRRLNLPGTHLFLARFTPEGNCRQLIHAQGNGLPFSLHANASGELLMGGIMGSSLTIGEVEWSQSSGTDLGFLASFDRDGRCRWLEPLHAQIYRIESDPAGDFYLTGDYHENLSFRNDSLQTDGPYDNDGFILKVDPAGSRSWLRRFGNRGNLRYGYRSQERGADLAPLPQGGMLVAAQLESRTSSPMSLIGREGPQLELMLMEWTADGQLLQERAFGSAVDEGLVQCLTVDRYGGIWIGGAATGRLELGDRSIDLGKERQSFILHLDAGWQVDTILRARRRQNMLFRAAASQGDRVAFTGHYQDSLTIGSRTIANDGRHGLFFFSPQ
ncbi:MAG: hypothetical protein KDC43_19950 [Saprospiraceae bacterium]|nr:hypothetical protein [Saprospiraceae bacterium]